MVISLVNFADLMLAALLVGAMFGAWLIFNPVGLTAAKYVAVQQQGIRALHPNMPALGALTIGATLAAALFARSDRAHLGLLLAAAACFAVTGLITRFVNQPINFVVMGWSSESLPANWTALRDKWFRWHSVRLVSGVAGLTLLIAATLLPWPMV